MLLSYSSESAGGLMTKEFITLKEDMTVGNALAKEGVVEIKERAAPRREHRVPAARVLDTLRNLEVFRAPR